VVDAVADVEWYFPNELADVPDILSREGVIPHSGGTGILWGNMTRIRGLMDVSHLDLKSFRKKDDEIVLGAALSYSEAAEALVKPDHPLVQSLKSAATEPLRNRISLGGSISMFPYWSDLMGPLLALDARLSLVGGAKGECSLTDYIEIRKLRQNTLITSIHWSDTPWQCSYYRHTRTPTDRPAFSLTVLLQKTSKRVETARLVVVGCKGRYRKLTEVEQILQGAELPQDPSSLLDKATERLELEIPARMGFSAEYLKACVIIELRRALEAALESNTGRVS
jgi:CO/xanthine dehydrogenase FAD-binding subunit